MSTNLNRSRKQKKEPKVFQLDKVLLHESSIPKKQTNQIAIPENEELIFALDIGTRTVVGIIGYQENDVFNVINIEIAEHKSRAMMDGQIHDIEKVAKIVGEVKENMEKAIGKKLEKVAIAAAGRALHTCQVRVDRDIELGREIKKDFVGSLEMEAIQKAQLKIEEEMLTEDFTELYCVGYSVIKYYLNGFPISSLTGHKGKKIGVDVLATFLPHIVVDSLYTVMGMVDLEVTSLTLEPIAALNVTIPKDLRMLNLSIVDIGAGTSDIAITKDGSVVAYAMAPVAGDELTEAIAGHFLTDFNMAEKIKIAYSSKKPEIAFTDILGKKFSTTPQEIKEVTFEAVNELGNTIAEKIIEYNGKAPNAVFLIGGGSQIPGLPEVISQNLKLPLDRVAVRGRDIIKNIKVKGKKLSGPEAITPIGIAVTAQLQKGHDFLSVTVNGKKVRLFNSRKLAVADALVLMGYNPSQLIGRSGKSINFELNGQRKYMRGEPAKAAEITVDGKAASLDFMLDPGCNITVVPAEDGKNAKTFIKDFIPDERQCIITLNGKKIDIGTRITINGITANVDMPINDGDKVIIKNIITVGDLISYLEIDTTHFAVIINDVERLNDFVICDGDKVEYTKRLESQTYNNTNMNQEFNTQYEKSRIVPNYSETPHINSFVNTDERNVINNDKISINVNGNIILLDKNKKYIFVDIFSHINFDLSKPQGMIVLKLNGKNAQFTDEVRNSDYIEIYWDKA